MKDIINWQNELFKEASRDKIPVTIITTNGFQLKGIITGFDDFVVILLSDGKRHMIYKHAISTVVALRPVKA